MVMIRGIISSLALLCASLVGCGSLFGQGYGAANIPSNNPGSAGGVWSGGADRILDPETALSFITIQGTAELRVDPQEIRLVLAVISEADSADLCQRQIAERVGKVRAAWKELAIEEDKVVEDFISVLPRYSWNRETRNEQDVLLQERSGYRMQSNLHLSVRTEAEAMQAINAAFANGVSDIVTFDYWSGDLEEQQQKARAAALAAARKKADTLLAVFEEPPPLINIQERTKTFLPHALYQTFENVLEETASFPRGWRELPQIRSYRPKMTFFDGLKSDADVRPATASLKPTIAVISTVRLYFQSPATKTPFPAK